MQGLTDFVFRQKWQEYFSGIDKFFTPYVRFERNGSIANKYLRDINAQNNSIQNTVPQILTNSIDEFIEFAKTLEDIGYSEMNLNLGCPAVMVIRQKLGSGLLAFPHYIEELLEKFDGKSKLKLSVKLRLGVLDNSDIDNIIPILNSANLSEVILHPRTAEQMYDGEIDFEKFKLCAKEITHPVVFNGNIYTKENYDKIVADCPEIKAVMIGRGVIANPFLINQIEDNSVEIDSRKLREFHDALLDGYASYMEGGDKQIIMKMYEKWVYMIETFPFNRRLIKKIGRLTNLKNYVAVVNEIFD